MAKKQQKEAIFTPIGHNTSNNGKMDKAVTLPDPTKKSYKDLGLTKKDLVGMFESMQQQRRFEERAMQMYQKGKFGGFLHLYIGQEAISTGSVWAMNDDDDIITAYRDHGWGMVRGVTPEQGMAELYGKSAGCSKGKGGSMHFANVKEHFWGGFGIVGGHIPLGTGIAFSNKYQDSSRVTACYIGDGAVHQGVLHEVMNMAQLWKLPVIYVVENNGYAMGTAAHRHSTGEIVDRADGYGMKKAVINGMDVLTVYEQMKEIVDDVRKHSEPWFVEIRTYRYRGHSMSDPQKYRTKEELQEYQKIDPVARLRSYILKNKVSTEKKLSEIEEKIEKKILDAIEFAENAEAPAPEALYEDMFSEENPVFHQ
ncbi:MAG: pyruvate dehydrogenase (acetyl-transferring) E1 component subunit alpha [Balneolaceae bacterium]